MTTILDAFARTVSSGWGTADTGETWTTTGGSASDYSVSSGAGRQTHTTVNTLRHSTVTVGSTDQLITVDLTLPVMPTGAGITHWVAARVTDTSNYYTARVDIATSGATTLTLVKRVAGTLSGSLASSAVGTHAAGNTWRVMFMVSGNSLQAKTWRPASDTEPDWQVSTTDTGLTGGTLAGLLSRTESGNTNASPQIAWDNLTAVSLDVEVTATEQDVYPPRVLVSVTGVPLGSSLEVYRVVGADRTLVRAASCGWMRRCRSGCPCPTWRWSTPLTSTPAPRTRTPWPAGSRWSPTRSAAWRRRR